MDYEKKYKDLLDKAKKLHDENCDGCKVCLESLFPELKESEDERIRKALINGIECFNEKHMLFNNGVSKNKVIAWLEKQGEQKPVEWSEEDGEHIESILSAIKCFEAENHDRQDIAELYRSDMNWLKSLKGRVQPQPKQEWSEEDEKKVDGIITILKPLHETECDYDKYKNSLIAWLKSLKDRYTWKPNSLSNIISGCNKGEFSQFEYSLIHFAMACSNENMTPKGIHCYAQTSLNEARKEIKLTEEDEKTVHLACEFIRHHSNHIDSIDGIDCSTLIERLKSLRTWKPSDEQMEALDAFLPAKRCDDPIFSLYDDLKKLREE